MNTSGNYTEKLADYVSHLKYDDLPGDVIQQAKRVILDALGCQVACAQLGNGRLMIQFGKGLGGNAEASVLGSDYKTTAINAALINGTLGHGDEIDESLEGAGHASSVIVPSALACGERECNTGKAMITAVVAGYDMAGHLRNAGISEYKIPRVSKGLARGLVISFWAAATASSILRLDTSKTRKAFGLAAVQAGGYYDVGSEGKHMAKSFRYACGGRNGVTAALLAQMGYDGPQFTFDGEENFLRANLGDKFDRDELIKDLGEKFTIMDTCFKLYSAGHPIHAAAYGLLKLLEREGIKADDIKSITARQPESEKRSVDNRDMPEVNIQYCLAVAAVDRQLTWDQYAPERLKDPRVLDLKSRIKSIHDPVLDERKQTTKAHSAQVDLETRDGRKFTERVDYPPGDPGNPASQADIENKVAYYAAKVLGQERAQRLIETATNLEHVADLNQLGTLLRK